MRLPILLLTLSVLAAAQAPTNATPDDSANIRSVGTQ